MNKETLVQVLQILVQSAEAGQKAGAFDLGSAGVISQAVELAKKEIAEAQPKPEAPVQETEEKTKSK